MKKRFLSLVLLLAVTCALCIGVGASSSAAEEPDDFVIMTEDGPMYKVSMLHFAPNNSTPTSLCDSLTTTTSYEFAYTLTVEQSNMTTLELVNWFMQTDIFDQITFSSLITSGDERYSQHPAFAELLSRKDLADTLEQIVSNSQRIPEKLVRLMGTNGIKEALSNYFYESNGDCQTLASIYSASAVSSTVGYIDDRIPVRIGGYVTTHDGLNVPYYVPERDMTTEEIAVYNNAGAAVTGATKLTEPDATYNCHAYAWYHAKHLDAYWINSIQAFINDSACTRLTSSDTIQVGDIIVYMSSLHDLALHSGVVDSINSDGSLVIRSKWGAGGEYLHAVNQVPSTYIPANTSYQVFYRYHNYTSSYNGNNYHRDNLHYFGYNKYCNTCSKTAYSYWESVPCSGPPCNTPWSLPDEGVAA